MIDTATFEKVEVTTAQQLHTWLEVHHAQTAAIWLITYKKHVSGKYVSVDEILDEILCFGWIDGIRRKLDEDRTMQLLSPRRQQRWAQTYKDRAARLTNEGRMQAAGFRAIEAAQESGLWNATRDIDALVVPEDLMAALAVHSAMEHFAAFAPSYRRNVLRWISIAKAPAARAKRVEMTATLAATKTKVPQF
jgi:uncharacterized protein YdeI (YjbR/CyaY-like superfamily)